MIDDEIPEGRLRELLRDPGWSLPPWPDAPARIRRAARWQRVKSAGLAACAGAVAAAVAVPLALSGGQVQGTPASGGQVQGTPARFQQASAPAGRTSAVPSAQGAVARIVMPDVIGLDLKPAEAVLRAVTSRPDIVIRRVRTSGRPGIVIAQNPAPGTRTAVTARITLRVSRAG